MSAELEFAYDKITDPSSIRLLYLLPAANPTDHIRIILKTVTLDENPEYEAISYCWGNQKTLYPVLCGDICTKDDTDPQFFSRIPTTHSLISALQEFRMPNRTRVLWADAICINQQNAVEKGSQVKLMARIYEQATCVLIWLGPNEDGLINVGKTVSEALDLLPPPAYDAEELHQRVQTLFQDTRERLNKHQPNLLSHDWRPLVTLLDRPWFRRRWIVQEVALARQAVMFAGHIQLQWSKLGQLAYTLESLGAIPLIIQALEKQKEFQDDPQRSPFSIIRVPLHNATIIFLIKIYRVTGTLTDCIVATAGFLCTEEQDYVYAVLNLPVKQLGINPDYHSSAGEVFRHFTMTEISKTENLKLLSLAPHKLAFSRPGVQRLSIPSWVPDLRQLGEVDTLASYSFRQQLFQAGGLAKPVVKFSDNGKFLICQGRRFDSLKHVSPSIFEGYFLELPELRKLPIGRLPSEETELEIKRIARWALNCYDLTRNLLDSYPTAVEHSRAFARTMLCGMIGMRDRVPEEVLDAFPAYMQHLADILEGTPTNNDSYPAEQRKYVLNIQQSLNSVGVGRSFCLTDNGRFAQSPVDAKTGDELWILVGAEVPFVVRPTLRGTYELIGECYVDGVMQGEVLEMDGFKASEIRIE